MTIRYIPTSTRITDPAASSAFHLRGERGVNDFQAWPVYDPTRHFPLA